MAFQRALLDIEEQEERGYHQIQTQMQQKQVTKRVHHLLPFYFSIDSPTVSDSEPMMSALCMTKIHKDRGSL